MTAHVPARDHAPMATFAATSRPSKSIDWLEDLRTVRHLNLRTIPAPAITSKPHASSIAALCLAYSASTYAGSPMKVPSS
jgi:hypothetical protein